MFKTIFTVQRNQGDSTVYHAYFEEYDDAKAFAEKEVASIDDRFSGMAMRHYADGSFQYSWTGNHNEILINDFAWVTDYRVNGVRFHDSQGLTWNYDNYAQFKSDKLKIKNYGNEITETTR